MTRTPLDQSTTPYASALQAQAAKVSVNLMVPGHGATSEGLASELADFCGERALALDIPPLINGIDVGPASPLVQATELAAEAWGAQKTWFLANGASQANRMAALAIAGLGRGDSVIAQRSAHSSFTDGVILGDLLPLFVIPSIDTARGINHGVHPDALHSALTSAENDGIPVSAVYIISPSYFGAVADVTGLSRVAHEHGVPLVVDGAWGPHFGFHEDLPESPTRLGADLTVSSTHKLAGSLTQSAMLHLSDGPFANRLLPLLERAYMTTQTTSPSALLLGSLDIARRSMATGHDLIGASIVEVEKFRDQVRASDTYTIISDGFSDFDDIIAHDPMRVSIDVSATGLSGHKIRDILDSEFDIHLEISTAQAVVAFIGPGKFPDLNRFANALLEIASRLDPHQVPPALDFPPLPQPGPMIMRPRAAYFSQYVTIPADQAAGRVSADALAAYPPGIPNVIPGEAITPDMIKFLQQVAASPIGYVRGALDSKVSHFRVVIEPGE
ncbi:aminotransferase class I/II-fold pyridoxal phosphate-dependent enzyme [Leucobacter salsicius]|uniref:aminotransferase class I/II-fold pyridoxal phosphate-dependent enzyme n=1 Tax=Leucobacter salsicius TaxID=664638 RepID=UPI0003476802|nr:DegT/DnrJ/EryC1/StrS family aminotransferase [Leucobacter salsicius]